MIQPIRFTYESIIEGIAPEVVFAWHESPKAFEVLTPPWEAVWLEKAPNSLNNDALAIIRIPLLGHLGLKTFPFLKYFAFKWIAKHHEYQAGYCFTDSQVAGSFTPFASWKHQHICEPHPQGTLLRDDITFSLHLAFLTHTVLRPFMLPFLKWKLNRLFKYRHQITIQHLNSEQGIDNRR